MKERGKRGHEQLEIPEVGEGEQCPTKGGVVEFGAFCIAVLGP